MTSTCRAAPAHLVVVGRMTQARPDAGPMRLDLCTACRFNQGTLENGDLVVLCGWHGAPLRRPAEAATQRTPGRFGGAEAETELRSPGW